MPLKELIFITSVLLTAVAAVNGLGSHDEMHICTIVALYHTYSPCFDDITDIVARPGYVSSMSYHGDLARIKESHSVCIQSNSPR